MQKPTAEKCKSIPQSLTLYELLMQNGRMEPIVFHSLTESNYKKICHLKKKSANHASSIILIIVLGILYMLKRFCVVSTSYKLKPIYYYSASSHQASVQNHYPQWVGSGV